MKFTAHNVLLDNGQKTMGNDQVLIADSHVWKSVEKTLNLLLPLMGKEKRDMRVVDLGCLEGGYTVEFARMGFQAIGIDAREENIANCNYVKSHLNLPNLSFAKDDARNVQNYGNFDITLCYGLLYHLDNPVEYLKTLGNCTSKILFLHTHVAPERDIRYDFDFLNRKLLVPLHNRFKSLRYRENYRLSPIVEHENCKGRWYPEWNENENREKVEKEVWASYNNYRSFWPLKTELVSALHKVGFDSVFEQFDFTGDIYRRDATEYNNRSMFVAVKH
ncbi:class I SAM-dependent methyltransferase [Flavihumibacter solisilvae]|uniref:Methyltransferase type 11 n=1 Tax=Flavihumibacter solisilvae TaxID=1349421 RepID=A0A0C1L1B0_9BACT|nr:methyltransferase domain-containing protein [Flavihumibacter solisilvae]KIC93817.1 methyltransferase type 11 [Flavihumibacter solisilvae]